MSRRPEQVTAWLRTRPSLSQVCEAYPQEWEQVSRQVATLVARDDPEAVTQYLARTARGPQPSPGRRPPEGELIAAQVRRYLTVEALNQAYLRATTGVDQGRVRMPLVSGWIAQRLLFAGGGLDRKPVPALGFRLVWPLLRGRRRLMPLVRPRGIYCFYSRALIRELAALIGTRDCLEIAAGDGTLARFLAAEGVSVVATDDRSWDDVIDYPEHVQAISAGRALRVHQPQVVICSWPPPGNGFERQVFATPSVRLYIVITTRHEASAGDWQAYRGQRGFDLVDDARLGWLVLPPELDGAVLVFRRTPPAA
jgi:hypothetical protein